MQHLYSQLSEADKHAIDLLGLSAVWLVLYDNLPEVGIIVTTLWTIIRIYETDTIQNLLGKNKKKEGKDG